MPITHTYVSAAPPVVGKVDSTAWNDVHTVTYAYASKAADYTLTIDDYVVECTTGTFTITLPTAVGVTGQIYYIKSTSTGVITIATTSNQTIDGMASGTPLLDQYDCITLQSNGANWIIL